MWYNTKEQKTDRHALSGKVPRSLERYGAVMAVKKQTELTLSSPVTSLPGVGPAKAAAYKKQGVVTVEDLIYHIPRGYENRGAVCTLDEARTDGKSAVVLTVATVPYATRLRGRMTVVKCKAYDDSGVCELTFFNQPYLRDVLTVDSEWRFYGVVERKHTRNGYKYAMTSPSFERFDPEKLKDFVAVYPLSEGLSQKQVAQNIDDALKNLAEQVADILPDEIRRENGLCTLPFALKNIHNPADFAALAAAKRRLVFDELFCFSMLMQRQGKHTREDGAYACTKQNITPLLQKFPYELTNAQKNAVRDIAEDMKKTTRMSRIVIGDVGCGKTAVAAAAVYIAALNGRQAALMAPTEILARQHYEDLAPLFESLGLRVALLIGATTAAQKKKIKAGLAAENPADRIDFVIGTQALITENTQFAALSLVITDEQHRFGVGQRAALAEKAGKAHILAMSATPIPRSLALVLYGDLDISKIDEMPAGRQKVDTYLVDEAKRDRVNAFIEKTAKEGGQCYIVCPSIEEKEADYDAGEVSLDDISEVGITKKTPLKAATKYAEDLQNTLPDLTVALIHGKLKAAQKEAIMTGFAAGDIDVLVSTTVIEVGVNVPNASLMIIENADRFGLSQLHQLRGRVGRGKRKSYCILISDSHGETAQNRLGAMTRTNNGFEIAEEDLKNRGPGDFISSQADDSIRQSGGMRFRFADLGADASLFAATSDAAKHLTETDPALENYPALREHLARMTAGDTILS